MSEIVQLWLSQLWKLLVLWPAWLLTPEGRRAALTRKTAARLAMVALAVLTLVLLSKGLPVDPAVIAAGDAIAYVDVIVIALASGAVGFAIRSAKAADHVIKTLIQRRPRRGRTTSRRRTRRTGPPANDDDGGAAPLYGRLRAA